MIELPRREAGRFRALARRCAIGRPRAPSPPVLLRQGGGALILFAQMGETSLQLRLSSAADSEMELTVPFALLEAVEGNDSAACRIEVDSSDRVRAAWTEGQQPREAVFDAVSSHEMPALPATRPRLRPVDAAFLSALHECGRTTAREGVRFAFSRLLLRGDGGQVQATDGRQLLVWNGFELPFSDDVLVPAIPAFGSRELSAEKSVRVGRSGGQILVEAGCWTVGLKIDANAKFPKTASLLARSGDDAELRLSETDVESILQRLRLGRSELPTVTVRIGPKAEVSWSGTRVGLTDSEATGSAEVSVLGGYLQRALQLGLRHLRADRAGATVLFGDERRSYLVSTISPESSQPGAPADADRSIASRPAIPHEGGSPMSSPKNGHVPDEPSDDELLDPVAEAEGVKSALAEAGRRVGRLVASLKQIHKQRRVLQTAWSSLKQLGLGGKEGP